MFQNQNQTNFSQKKDLKIEDFYIRTMKKDLQEINNPVKNTDVTPEDTLIPPVIPRREIFSETRESSPFLQKITSSKKEPNPSLQPPSSFPAQPKATQTNTVVTPIQEPVSLIQFPQQDSTRSRKLLNVFLIISLLIAILGGFYYAWYTGSLSNLSSNFNFSFTSILSKLGFDSSMENPPDNNIYPEIPKYSSDKPNYLNIDTENADKLKIEESIKKYANEINTLGISAPIEFIVVDLQNNPVSFADFNTKAELNLPSHIVTQLESNFSLFIYNDNKISKLGLVVPTKNTTTLKESFLMAEKTLTESLKLLFLSQKITFDDKPFSNSSYGESSIRYKNLTPELSIDYSITNNKLLIGTSKMTIRAIIDYQKKK